MRTLAFVVLILTFISPAIAGSLNSDQVNKFVASVDAVHNMGKKMEAEGRSDVISEKVKKTLMSGDFSPYSSAVKAMKVETPADYKALSTMVTGQGFSSAEDWASVGDMVSAAYVAETIGPEMAKSSMAMHAMPPEQIQKMPAEVRAQIEAAKKTMEYIQSVPQNHKDAIRPHMDALNQKFSKK